MDWVNGFIIPLVEVTLLGGLGGWILFIVGKAFWNGWSKAGKFIWKYKIRRKAYPEKTMKWILECYEKGVGWYDAKKILMVAGKPTAEINEVLWIYDQLILELNKEQGGKNNGRKYQRGNSKDESQSAELPSI